MNMLISYNTTNGTARTSCETGSAPGVRKAASIIIITIECLLYFLIKLGLSMPSFDKKNEIIGSSKTNPAASITLIIIDIYSSIANSFLIDSDPNSAANFSVNGSIAKYANAIPLKKQIDENATIQKIYRFSFFLNAGEMNCQN